MTPDTKISASDLSLTFQTNDGPVHALQGVSLDIKAGEFVSFIGPSGCGKTTFLRVVADLEQPTGGAITVNGVTPQEARLSRAYGYVFQAAGLYSWRTIGGNIRLPLEIMGYSKAEQSERVARVLEMVDLAGFEKKFPWQLSGGMQQRASIARALAFDADILLMDEPFGALDALTRGFLQDEIERIWEQQRKTVIMITHSIEEALLLSDRIVMMTNGPNATIGEILPVDLERPRHRLSLAEDPRYNHYRAEVVRFLHERHLQKQQPGDKADDEKEADKGSKLKLASG